MTPEKKAQLLAIVFMAIVVRSYGITLTIRPVQGESAQQTFYTALRSIPNETNVAIRLSPGDYYFSEPLRLDSLTIPSSIKELTLIAEKQGTVRILGSIPQKVDFRPSTKNIYTTKLLVGNFRNLYLQDTLAPLAQSELIKLGESETLFKHSSNGFVLLDSLSPMQRNPSSWKGAELWGLDQWRLFGGKIVDATGDTLLLDKTNLLYWSSHWESGAFFRRVSWIRNHLLLLDQPGEWYFDSPSQTLSVFIPSETPIPQKISVGKQSTLVLIAGYRNMPRITIRDIEFTQTGWSPPPSGFITHQIKHVNQGNAEYLPAAIEASNVEYFNLSKCNFRDIGADAVHLLRGSKFNTIQSNSFNRIAGSAIVLGESSDTPAEVQRLGQSEFQTYSNLIENNTIQRAAQLYSGSVAIFLAWGHNNLISYNSIYDLPYSGISVGWGWGAKNYSHDNIIKANTISNVCQLLPDGAAIYLMGWQGDVDHGPKVLDNTIERWHGYAGIYLDNGLEHALVQGNRVVHGVSGHWIHVQPLSPPALNNTIRNNDTLP